MLEFPFSIKWTISEENLRALKNSNGKQYLKSDTFTAFKFSPIPYHFELYPNRNSYENLGTVCIIFLIQCQQNVYTKYSISNDSGNYIRNFDYVLTSDIDGFGARICKTEEYFDSKKSYIVQGRFTIKIEGSLKIKNYELKWNANNLDLWNNFCGNFMFKIGENHIWAHQSFFASESPIFAAMFEQLKDENEKIIEIPDFSFEIVQKAIKLIYHRDLVQKIPLKDALLFLKFAITYDLSILKNNLELYIGCNLTIVKVYDSIY
uniref:BTB domain-containing protein n=1 Tax=Panagrolaimus davidi TaxID=227884 RepID=A0A914PE28_9BILA